MSYQSYLRDDQWDRIKDGLPGTEGYVGRGCEDNRRFVEAVIWVGRNGGRWRSIPEVYGNWNSIHRRFRRWSKRGIWQRIFNELARSADTEWVMIDSTIIRAHQHAAGARKQQVTRAAHEKNKRSGAAQAG